METTQQQLLDNHLAFLASHRGLIRTEGNIVYVESDRPEFTFVIPGRNSKVSDLSPLVKTLQHLPWCGLSIEDIKGLGFASKFGISYMVLDDKAPEWSVRKDLGIERVQNRDLMDVFSRVQSRSFNEADEGFEAWYPWLKAEPAKSEQQQPGFLYWEIWRRGPWGCIDSGRWSVDGHLCGRDLAQPPKRGNKYDSHEASHSRGQGGGRMANDNFAGEAGFFGRIFLSAPWI